MVKAQDTARERLANNGRNTANGNACIRVGSDLHLCEMLLKEIEGLEKLVYVPGQWRCAKCDFRLTQSNLYVLSGTVGPRDEPGDKCPNCDSPLWRVSAMDDRNEAFKCANDMFDRFYAMRAAAQQAYGALWREIGVTSPRVVAARKALLAALTKEEQQEAVATSVDTFGPVSDQEAIAADMQAGVFPDRTMTAQPGNPNSSPS